MRCGTAVFCRSIIDAIGTSFRRIVPLGGAPIPRSWRVGADPKQQVMKPERCLAAHRRRAGKVLRVPVPRDAPDLEDRNGRRDLKQCDDRRCGYDGGCRVHHDAQRAMICVSGSLVGMRDLRNRQ